jgi:hypothetical protein
MSVVCYLPGGITHHLPHLSPSFKWREEGPILLLSELFTTLFTVYPHSTELHTNNERSQGHKNTHQTLPIYIWARQRVNTQIEGPIIAAEQQAASSLDW